MEALQTLSTDSACASYQKGCVTTGKGCITLLGLCSSYKGTISTCEGFIGTDGKCKGTDTTIEGPCSPKICSEAPTSNTTNSLCMNYKSECVSNGAGCIDK